MNIESIIQEAVKKGVEGVAESNKQLQQSFSEFQRAAVEFQERRRIDGIVRKYRVSPQMAASMAGVELNDRAEQLAKERGISFGEALNEASQLPEFAETPKPDLPPIVAEFCERHPEMTGYSVDPASIAVNAEIEHLARVGKITFGEALDIANSAAFGEAPISPEVEAGKRKATKEAQAREQARDALRKKHNLPGEKIMDSGKGILVMIRAGEIEKSKYDRRQEKSTITYEAALEQAWKELSAEGWKSLPAEWK
ncbi:MAG: hypothetical protein JXA73_00195 [Acidobacteria bacterium]|nr:hypothetical protein [Acidobacteriota bacterium]